MSFSPPPSSRRLNTNELHIQVAMQSQAMQDLAAVAASHIAREVYTFLVVHPDDSSEAMAFAKHVAERKGRLEPRPVYPAADTFTRNPRLVNTPEEEKRAVVIWRTHQCSAKMLDEFVRRHERGYRYDHVIALVPSIETYRNALPGWPVNGFTKLFARDPLEWPSLKGREADHRSILHAIADVLVSRDGRAQAELTEGAIDMILRRRAKRTMELYTRVRDAFDVMLRSTGATKITAEHVEIAGNKDRRRQLFSQTAASAD